MQIPASSSSSRPHHTGGSDSSDDDTSSSSSSSESEETPPEAGFTVDAAGTYHVYNEKGLRAWASNPNVQGTDCTLENNIELEGEWTPIGTSEGAYKGTFDGQGHTISGLKVTGTGSDENGIFGVIEGGCVKNLRLENPVVNRTLTVPGIGIVYEVANNGAIAGSVEANTTITGCCSVGSTVAGNTVDGGIVASVLDKNAAYLTANACYWDGGPENGVGTNPDHQGVTKVDGTTTTWSKAIQDMERASDCQFEVDASGKPTGVG